MSESLPSLVILGRPNVGKSSLFNRLTGTRRSIVTDEPGITRDRIYGKAEWEGRPFEVVDTGGIVPGDKAEIPREIMRQAQVAIKGATELLLVVDARAGVTPLDSELAELLRRTGKPFAVAANKVDTAQQQPLTAPFFKLTPRVFPISAEHGFGVDDMLDAVVKDFPKAESVLPDDAVQVAIIGRPNVGKSTLLNRLAGEERAIVSPIPGTTRDSVDTAVHRGDRNYRFVDTAGIRKKGKTKLVAEKLSVVLARKSLERADVALLVADASQGVSGGDATIAGYAKDSGRSVIIVMNKWDLAVAAAKEKMAAEGQQSRGREPKPKKRQQNTQKKEDRRTLADPAKLAEEYEKLVRMRFKFLDYAPVIFLSALTGDRADSLYELIDRVAAARRRRISTGELNRWISEVDLDRGTSPSARRIKIYYITQASNSPPTFVLFTNQKKRLHFSYERFLENQLRVKFDFLGTPIRFLQRMKER